METQKLLVLENDEFNFILLEELLIPLNTQIIRAKNYEEVFLFITSEIQLDLAILDIKIENHSKGISIMEEINKYRPDLKIIITTASMNAGDFQKQATSIIFQEYFYKPINIEKFISAVESYLSKDYLKTNKCRKEYSF